MASQGDVVSHFFSQEAITVLRDLEIIKPILSFYKWKVRST